MTATMFDPDEYRSRGDRSRNPPAKRVKLGPVPAPDSAWHVISTAAGPVDNVHRVDIDGTAKMRREARLDHTAVVTECNIVGRQTFTCEAGAAVYLCPRCAKC